MRYYALLNRSPSCKQWIFGAGNSLTGLLARLCTRFFLFVVILQYPMIFFNNWLLYDNMYEITFELANSFTENILHSHKLISVRP